MKYKDFKWTISGSPVSIVEVFDADLGLEFDPDYPEELLDEMEVVKYSRRGDWLTVELSDKKYGYIRVEVPNSCRECPLFVQGVAPYYCAGDTTYYGEHSDWLANNYASGRPDWCPIEEDK